MEALQEYVDSFTYLGIFVVLVLGSLGVPIPEEMPIIAAALLSHEDVVRWWLALPICLLGVLSGDMVLYWVGRHWGEQVLRWPLVRLVLSPAKEQWLQAAYRRHAFKTVVTARHVMGLRAAAFLTAGPSACGDGIAASGTIVWISGRPRGYESTTTPHVHPRVARKQGPRRSLRSCHQSR